MTTTSKTVKSLERLRAMTDGAVITAAWRDPDAQPLMPDDFKRMKRVARSKIIRQALGSTQEEFATRFKTPLGTLRVWEQAAAEPDTCARAYLTVIARNPDAVTAALAPEGRRVPFPQWHLRPREAPFPSSPGPGDPVKNAETLTAY